MKNDQFRKLFGWILLVSFVFVGFFTPVGKLLQLPEQIVLLEGSNYKIPRTVAVNATEKEDSVVVAYRENELELVGKNAGADEIILDIAGLPIKKMDVQVLGDLKVIPGGQSIGVKIHSKGILVVGYHQIATENGKQSPAEESGLKIGDRIMNINGKPVDSINEIAPIVQKAGETGEPLKLLVHRSGHEEILTVHPVKDREEGRFKLGLYIRDSAAGIGTLTFYEPKSRKYGALGHVISDMDTKTPIAVKDGYIVPSTVTSIQKGENGFPGEKMARFLSEKNVVGDIRKNNQFGIYGTLKRNLDNGLINKPIPIALSHEVKKGPAEILTVVDENKVERFDIEIISSIPQKFPATKGMVIKITDPELLKKTGGIVQGMSGSPIIQNGKLVGAVTHVFVNDPTSGYGVHIEWMLNEAGIPLSEDSWRQAG